MGKNGLMVKKLISRIQIFYGILYQRVTIPNLFPKEAFNLDQGTSEIKWQYVERGDTKSSMRATNFGAYVNLASRYMHENRPNPEVKQLLMDYYNKYHGL